MMAIEQQEDLQQLLCNRKLSSNMPEIMEMADSDSG